MNPTNSKPIWIRITTAAGITCAAISLCSYIFLMIIWRINGSWGRLGDRTIGLTILETMFGTLVCGIILLKYRKKLAKILITIGIIVLILGLLTPEL
jgi:hypothetical protein